MGIRGIGIIPDGTRRWAAREGKQLFEAYVHAFRNLRQQIDLLGVRGVQDIHVYMFSLFNLKRQPNEVTACLEAEYIALQDLIAAGYPMVVVGDLDAIHPFHPEIFSTALSIRANARPVNEKPLLHLYLGYSFEQYLADIGRSTNNIEAFTEVLLREKVDLIIRTGGAVTLSDFMPIQSRYAQLYFLQELFNDFTVDDLADLCDRHERKTQILKYGE